MNRFYSPLYISMLLVTINSINVPKIIRKCKKIFQFLTDQLKNVKRFILKGFKLSLNDLWLRISKLLNIILRDLSSQRAGLEGIR